MLAEVLDRLHKYSLHLRISTEGLQPVEKKSNAVKRASTAHNVSELRSFLGKVQYYHSFLQGLSTTLAPLHRLMQKIVQREWTKEVATSDSLLVHYDLNQELRLACDV